MHKKNLFPCTALLTFLALSSLPTAGWAKPFTLTAASFQSNGSLISGWHWVRSPGNQATWVFNVGSLAATKPQSVFLNMSPLVTNGANGGSGYTMTAHLEVSGPKPRKMAVALTNPFRPIDPENSGGVGYQTYGHSAPLPIAVLKGADTLTLTLTFEPRQKNHIAVNKDCLSIGYSK